MGDEIVGDWWVPEEPERRTQGTLSVDAENSMELSLQGTLKKDSPLGGIAGPAETVPVILGDTSSGRITLVNAYGWALGLAMLPGAFGTSAYSPSAALFGVHFDADDLGAIRRIAVEFSGLIDWLETPGIPTEEWTNDAGALVFRATAERQVERCARISGATFTFRVDADVNLSRSRVAMQQNARVLVELDEAGELWPQFQQWVIPMRDLLALATARPVRMENLSVARADNWARFVAPLRQPDAIATDRPLDPNDILLRSSDISDRLDDAIGAWYQVHEKVRPALDAISAIDRAPFVFAETRFSNYAGAADQLHAALIRGTAEPKDVHREKVRRVLEVCPPQLRDWAKRALARNDKSFRTRVEELVESAGKIGSHGLAPDLEWFAGEVTQLRHLVAHGSRHGVSGKALYWFSRALLWLIRARLLKELGVPQDVIEKRVFHGLEREGVTYELSRIRTGGSNDDSSAAG